MLATYTVNVDYDAAAPFNFNDNIVTLREAVSQADQSLGHDTIDFAPGLTSATITLGKDGNGNSIATNELSITDSVTIDGTIDGAGPSEVPRGITIDVSGSDPTPTVDNGDGHTIFNILSGSGGPVEINGLKLTGGDALFIGGAISAGRDLTVKNSEIFGNASQLSGGGISASRNLTVEYCTISGNKSSLDKGGGIAFNTTSDSVLTVGSSTISGNSALGGGAISAVGDYASVNIQSSFITGNQAQMSGGGLLFEGKELSLQSVEIRENTAGGDGGGLRAAVADFATDGSIMIDQSLFDSNQSTGGGSNDGGASVKCSNSAVTITETVVSNNKALGFESNVGGISIYASNSSTVTIDKLRVFNNHADDDVGGLLIKNDGSVATVKNSTSSGNTAAHNASLSYNAGGGVWLRTLNNGSTRFEYSTVSGNTTVDDAGVNGAGGGVFIQSFSGATRLRNATISGNKAQGSGGGVGVYAPGGDVLIQNSTITNNRANSDNDLVGSGGGIRVIGSGNFVTIDHTIVAGNFRGLVSTRDDISGAIASAWSLIGDNTGATITNNGGNQWGTSISPIDPYLLPLAFNGGPTMTHALQAFSPARNMGDPSAIPGVSDVPQYDQRGADFSRKVGTRIDIGAYEADVACVYVSTIVDDFDSDLSYGDLSLREAINYANLAGVPTTICLPAGHYYLTRSGTESTTNTDYNDLDIFGNMKIIGAGPGATIIDGGNLTTDDRVFDVANLGVLGVSHATIALGAAPVTSGQRDGGAVRVKDGGQFDLDYSAVVGNATTRAGDGGAIYFAATGHGSITYSVITVNVADDECGGVYLKAASSPGAGGTVTMTNTIVVNNTDGPNSAPDVYAGTYRTFTSGGYNRLGNAATGFTNGVNGDYIKPTGTTVAYVVTSVVDGYDGTADLVDLSLRDAIHLANTTTGTQEIWLPAWDFVLTRQRTTAANLPELNVSEGDIEITESLILHGIGGASGASTSVAWAPGTPADKVFELVGDYDGSGAVGAGDYDVWRNSSHAADGDDDGDVDGVDQAIMYSYYTNTLQMFDIAV